MKKRLLILINGAAPGLGKSTLAESLAQRLQAQGRNVDCFLEQEILERNEFQGLVEEWHATGNVADSTLLKATRAYLDSCRNSDADTFVIDSLLPFLPSLLAWGRSDHEIVESLAALGRLLRDFRVLHLQLEGHTESSLMRAARREGGLWLDRFARKVAGYRDEARGTSDLASVIAYLDVATARSHRLLKTAPWSVHFINVDGGADSTLVEVLELIRG